MSDVIVSTTESKTNVTTTNDVTTIAITDTVVEVSASSAGLQGVPGSNSDSTYVFVTNKTGATLSKGTIVYVSGANGTHTQVSKALATGDTTSARTLGWLSEDIANNATGLCMVEGYLDGVNTQGVTEGAQLYLSPTVAGGFTETKPQAPDHLVYVGVCAKASAGNGRVFVKVQNGYELDELHNVRITSPQDNNVLEYESATSLWKNVAATAITVGSAVVSGTAVFATTSGSATVAGSALAFTGNITRDRVSDFTSGTVASAGTAQQSGTAVYASTSGTSVYATTSGTAVFATSASSATNAATATSLSGSITRSQVSDFTSGTVTSASTAQQAGTAVFATTSGSAVTITGTITTSQVSDFASGTVANISGTVTQAQVSGLSTSLAGKANLTGGNSFTGAQIVTASTATQIPLQLVAGSATTVNVQEWDNSAGVMQASVDSNFRANFPRVTAGSTADLGYAILSVNTGATATVGAVIRGVAGQSGDLQQWQNSGGTTITRVDRNGAVSATYFGPSGSGLLGYLDWTTNSPIFNTGGTGVVGLIVKGASGQSANLLEIQNSGGTVVTSIISNGAIRTIGSIKTTALEAVGATLAIQPAATTTVGAVIRGAASQSANLQEWQTSSGSTAALVSSGGAFTTGGTARLGQVTVLPASTATVGVVVQGLSGQSANLQEWQSSTGSTAARIDSGGIVYGAQVRTTSSLSLLTESVGGGLVTMARATATPSAPGANAGRLYFRDGTNANTLKLVVRAGAAGAETTILDNIPT